MEAVSINKSMKLTEHFSLGEMTKTKHKTEDGNIPSRVAIENLKRLCGWLEMLRSEWNIRYAGCKTSDGRCKMGDDPIIINSAYRSWEVNKKAGGSATSNHLVGCAADIRCADKEQALRYAVILLDIADQSREDFDELIIEVRGSTVWVHFAVVTSTWRGLKNFTLQRKVVDFCKFYVKKCIKH